MSVGVGRFKDRSQEPEIRKTVTNSEAPKSAADAAAYTNRVYIVPAVYEHTVYTWAQATGCTVRTAPENLEKRKLKNVKEIVTFASPTAVSTLRELRFTGVIRSHLHTPLTLEEFQKLTQVDPVHLPAKFNLRTLATDKISFPPEMGELNEITGGIPRGRVTMVTGAPGGRKTAIVTQVSRHAARQGYQVAYYAADEHEDAIVTRLGQLAGEDRWTQEDPEIKARLISGHEDLPYYVYTPHSIVPESSLEWLLDSSSAGDDTMFFEDVVVQHLARCMDPKSAVFVIDSLQKAPFLAAQDAQTQKEEIDAKIKTIRKITALGVTIIAISEQARNNYKNDENALASGKESGSIEYEASLLIALYQHSTDLVKMIIPKNRTGATDETGILLRHDPITCALTLVDRAEVRAQTERQLLIEILTQLKDKPTSSIDRIGEMLRDHGAKFANQIVRSVIEQALADGLLQKRNTKANFEITDAGRALIPGTIRSQF